MGFPEYSLYGLVDAIMLDIHTLTNIGLTFTIGNETNGEDNEKFRQINIEPFFYVIHVLILGVRRKLLRRI